MAFAPPLSRASSSSRTAPSVTAPPAIALLEPSQVSAVAQHYQPAQDMHLSGLLADQTPLVRTDSFYGPPKGGRDGVVRGDPSAFARPSGFAPPPHAPRPPTFEPARRLSNGQPASNCILYSSSIDSIQQVLQTMREVVDRFSHAAESNVQSSKSLTALFNAYPSADRSELWSSWVLYSSFCRGLGIPVFPIEADKVAVVLAAHVELPISAPLRSLARPFQVHPEKVERAVEAMKLAGTATRHSWPDIKSFVREVGEYESMRVLLSLSPLRRHVAPTSPDKASPPPLIRDVTARPLLTNVPPNSPPHFPALTRNRFSPPAPPVEPPCEQTLRSLGGKLPVLLKDMQAEPSDPIAFDVAGERFQATANSPAFAARVESLFNTATIYTHISALLSFPTYPVTTRKLAMFALAMTPGSLGKMLDEVEPEVTVKRECPRATGKQLETLLKDVTVLRMITKGGDEHVEDEEKSEWLRWRQEIEEDWKGAKKPEPKKKRPSQTGKKSLKREASPAESETSTASTSRKRTSVAESSSTKPARKPRSRLHPTDGSSSRAASRSATPSAPSSSGSRSKTGTPSAPDLARQSSQSSFAAPLARSVPNVNLSFPKWVPPQRGQLPQSRREPALPAILECPWWIPKKKKQKHEKISAAGDSDGSALTEEEEEEEGTDEEYEEAQRREAIGRSIATHRPKRGGLVMRPFDVTLLWD
ncbi:hypothetical protein JCM11641_000336 [Rhodosporidiobolus odoratus]